MPSFLAVRAQAIVEFFAEEKNRELVRLILAAVGHRVSEAASGAEAVRATAAEAFDLVLMDVQMPEMDGLAATRAIRAAGGPNAATPILALSANVMADQVAQCVAAGMSDHIAKPLQVAELIGKVAAWLAADRPALDHVEFGLIQSEFKKRDRF